MRIEPIQIECALSQSTSNWIDRLCSVCAREYVIICVSMRCEAASAMASGWTTEETGALVGIWRQVNVQNELDAVARVVSSARELSFPLRLS